MRGLRLGLVLALAVMVASCQSFGASKPLGLSRPPEPCPAAITAPLTDEPLMPEGYTMADLPPWLAAWLFADLLPWAREPPTRLALAQGWCAGRK